MITSWPRRTRPAPAMPADPGPLPSRISGPLQFQPPPAAEQPRNCCGTDVLVFGHTLCPLAPPPPGRWRAEREQG